MTKASPTDSDQELTDAEIIERRRTAGTGRCPLHPAYDADYCPGCGTATQVRLDL